MDNGVYILGGIVNEKEINSNVFFFDSTKNFFIKTEFLVKPNYELYLNDVMDEITHYSSLNFINETVFLPLKFDINHETNAFYYCQFDTSDFLHIINVTNFIHIMMFQENKSEMWDEDSSDEAIEEKDEDSHDKSEIKTSIKSNIIFYEDDEKNDNLKFTVNSLMETKP